MNSRIKLYVESQIAKNTLGNIIFPYSHSTEEIELIVPINSLNELSILNEFSIEGADEELVVMAELKYYERNNERYGTATYELTYQNNPY